MPRLIRLLLAMAVLACVAIAPAATTAASDPAVQMRKIITVKGMHKHEQAFQEIANANGGIRASGTPGYEASRRLRRRQAQGRRVQPDVQPFDFPFFEELAPATSRGPRRTRGRTPWRRTSRR